MIKNKFYEAPEAELLVVSFEENFCGTTGDGTWDNSIRTGSSWASDPQGDEGYGLE